MTKRTGKISQQRKDAVSSRDKTISTLLRGCLSAWLPVCLLFSIVLPARGYVLQGPHLLQLMMENLGTASSLVVHQRLLIYDNAAPGAPAEVSETLTYRFSNAFRSESTSPRLNRIHVDTLDAALTIVDDRLSAREDSLLDHYADPFLFHSRVPLQKRLFDNGINPMVSSLGRLDGVPVYVLGAQYPDLSLPQLWLEKDTFRPIRLLFPDPDGPGGVPGVEFRYLHWQKNRKLWYPMRIQCYQDDRLIREMIVGEMIMNPLISGELFDIDRLRAQYGQAVVPEGEKRSDETPGDVRRTPDDLKNSMRNSDG